MKKATIILLCVAIIWSYTKTAIDGANSNCLLCKEAKTLFCRKKGDSIKSLEFIRTENVSFVERLIADENEIKLSESGVSLLNNMTSLRSLNLRKNKIGPDSLDHAIKHDRLEELDLDGNKIQNISNKFFAQIPKMEVLILSNNNISIIPHDLLENNKNIKALVLSNNKFFSTIPPELFKNSSLEVLLVDGTSLEDISFELLNKSLPKLIALNVRNNEKMVIPLNPKIFYEHPTLRFLSTSGYADCCSVKRMKKRLIDDESRNKWHCSYKHNKNRKESCAIRIRSAKADDTFMGHVEVYNATSGKWKKITGDWTMNDANAVCRETGHEKALAYINGRDYLRRRSLNNALFPADGRTELLKIKWKGNCDGSEYSILRCRNVNWSGSTDYEGVGVRCQTPEEEMKRVCKRSNGDKKFYCASRDLNNLPWQDQSDSIVETIDLSGNKITWIQDTSLKFFKKLIKLDLSSNTLAWLGNNIFQIDNLKVLILKNNDLHYITREMTPDEEKNARWFGGLRNLRQLDISSNELSTFPSNVFEPLENLHNMSMENNMLRSFPDDFFKHLTTMEYLDISNNRKLVILNWERLILDLKNLRYLKTNIFTDCCFVKKVHPGATCVVPNIKIVPPAPDCDRMITIPAVRYLMWLLIVLTIGGNVFALLMRSGKHDTNRVQNLLICNLCFSDMLMGVYLAGIINQDITTRGEYYKHDYYWRAGSSCKAFGIISVISSEVSAFTLVFIAYDRFLHIVKALEFKKIGYRTAVFLLIVTWFGCTAIAVIPATVQSYFYKETLGLGFYGMSPFCVPLQLHGEDSIAWEYCLAVFGAMNFIGAMYLIVAYCQIFYSSYTSAKTSRNTARLKVHMAMAKRFAAVVFTDVCCWVPIVTLLLLSLVRPITDTGLNVWFSIFVIPINPAINPILYTFSTPLFWQKMKKKMLFCISKGLHVNN